ncbi:MAG TPA: DUF6445 family protein [Burkholderiales bacterium]|nr:DUF6445 family protein [Burkholderiales bacterium]
MEVKPFIFDELFRLNLTLAPPQGTMVGEVPVLTIEDVLQDPQAVRETVGKAPATNWRLLEGGRNFVDYYDCRLRFPVFPPVGIIALAQHAIERAYGVSVEPQLNSIDVNWFMQIGVRPANYAVPHHDVMTPGQRTFTCMVYLNSPDECSGGTAFFRFRKTQSLTADERFQKVVDADERLKGSKEGEYWPPDADAYWEKLGAISMATGRMVIFPAQYFHAAWHPEDSFFDFPRLTLVFWMVA